MAEDWLGKMVAFLVVFFIVTVAASAAFSWNWQVGLIIGVVGAGAFSGVALRK